MAKYNYSTKVTENMARAVLRSAPISTKHSVEICNYLRGKNLFKAMEFLTKVMDLKLAVPFRRFNSDVGHKPGMGPGRYPVKASQFILKLMASVEANARFKGLSSEDLVIKHLSAQKASTPMRYGRHRGRQGKRTHIEIVVEEIASKKSKSKKTEKVKATKKEAKVEPKEESKVATVKKQTEPKLDKTEVKDKPVQKKEHSQVSEEKNPQSVEKKEEKPEKTPSEEVNKND